MKWYPIHLIIRQKTEGQQEDKPLGLRVLVLLIPSKRKSPLQAKIIPAFGLFGSGTVTVPRPCAAKRTRNVPQKPVPPGSHWLQRSNAGRVVEPEIALATTSAYKIGK
jgi:hypothetical protein